ncbi:kinase-like domain-containing protein [Ilyonectria robusta]|uniref:kinase-like domain-containing protein n=1 Tax=Ilyonectria robusta TaxID=1079257 RepID=UPI001E8CBFF7|nr:kinase-like domain-containing protein [Ilyonectria robusta]KAH8683689.1 kinase-like domain-containing protein [Ilyonectria robusta]
MAKRLSDTPVTLHKPWGYLKQSSPSFPHLTLGGVQSSAHSSRKTGQAYIEPKSSSLRSWPDDVEDLATVDGDYRGCLIVSDTNVDGRRVSKRHCLLFPIRKDGHIVVILQNVSTNGFLIKLNGEWLGFPTMRQLDDGDVITVSSDIRLRFSAGQNPPYTFRKRYSRLDLLGKGHFARVRRCRSGGRDFAARFLRTRQDTPLDEKANLILLGIQHPNIVAIREVFHEGDRMIYVMELMGGNSLFNLLTSKQMLAETEGRTIFRQVFSAIQFLHSRNIVHRDIKPESILMASTTGLQAKLGCFNFATYMSPGSNLETLCGDPRFLAPEMLRDSKHRRYGNAVDIWSMGVTMYICLCGFAPFSDELYSKDFPYTLERQIEESKFYYPSPYWDSASDPVLDLIDCMLCVDAKKRLTIEQCLAHPWLVSDDDSFAFETPLEHFADSKLRPPPAPLLRNISIPDRSLEPKFMEMAAEFKEIAAEFLENHRPRKGLSIREASDAFAENNRISGINTEYDENIYTIAIDKNHPQYRKRLATAEKKAREIERAAHTAVQVAEETHAESSAKLDELPEEVQDDLIFNDMGVQGSSWTFTEGETTSEHEIPLKIDGHPVVIPIRYYYPLMAISSPPPDPHPRIISPLDPLPDDTISEIFVTFTEAVGFYLLVNGYLQIIVPEDFDYESSISSLPDEFGGLKVSFIPQSLYPTAGEPVATATPSSTTQSGSGMTGGSSTTATEEPSNQPPATRNLPIRRSTSTIPEDTANQGITANFKGSLGSTIRAVVKGGKSKTLFEGKIGVLVTPVAGDNRKFATVPTHVFTSACNVSKMSSTEIADWIDMVSVQSTSTSTDLGNLVQVFDPCPQSFPIGFTSDVSLIDVSQIPATRVRSTAKGGLPIMQWLDQDSWKTIQYNSSNLFLLDGEPREAKSIGIVDSRCQRSC